MNKIQIKEYKDFNISEVLNLYKSVGWINYTLNPNKLEAGIKNSMYTVGAFFDNKLVGLIRCVGDEHTIIFIQDLLVNPEYQNKGIGKNLINNVLDKYKNVYQIQVTTDNLNDIARKLYESCGFKNISSLDCCSYMKQ